MHVTTIGSGPRVVLVHGSVWNGAHTWEAQLPLADQYTLVIPDRPGYPPDEMIQYEDFEEEASLIAELIGEGAHLVGFSYGGVIALFVAPHCPTGIKSLTVIEPPALGVARGNEDADALISQLETLWASGPRVPREFLVEFEKIIAGGEQQSPPDPLPVNLEQGVEMLMYGRQPWDADPPLEYLHSTLFPKLVISGGYSRAFEAVCDVLGKRIGATRIVMPGRGHNIPELGASLNTKLREFFKSAEHP